MENKDQYNQFPEDEHTNQVEQPVMEGENAEGFDQKPVGGSPDVDKLRAENQELRDKYLRQAAEFDNFRKRSAREKVELFQTAGKDVIGSLLEVIDDCDRAEAQFEQSADLEALRSGTLLIFNKLRNILAAKGLKPMDAAGETFDADQHEAITTIPAPSAEMDGKVLDVVEKGYLLNDKIIRFAKVVVGKA